MQKKIRTPVPGFSVTTLSMACLILAFATAAAAQSDGANATAAFAKAARSVVFVLDWNKTVRQGQIGTGILFQQNRVLTQCAPLRGVRNLGVKRDGMRALARLVREDRRRDLCELAVQPPGNFDAPALEARPVADVAKGDRVYALAAALETQIVFIDGEVTGLRGQGRDKSVQIAPKLPPGYGGGPLFDRSGALIGVNVIRNRNGESVTTTYPIEFVLDVKLAVAKKPEVPSEAIAPPPSTAAPKPDSAPSAAAASPPPSSTPPAPRPAPASADARPRDPTSTETVTRYLEKIVEASINHAVYPKEVADAKLSGTSTIRFRLAAGGELRESFVETSSGYAALDVAALLAVRKAISEIAIPQPVQERGFKGLVVLRFQPPTKP